jgi:hypothetical protein
VAIKPSTSVKWSMGLFKRNRQTAYAIMTENEGSFISTVGIGINQERA